MKSYVWSCLREETGNVTLEASLLAPVVICLICALLLGNILTFQTACQDLTLLKRQNEAVPRRPGEVIHNTDLVFHYLERLQNAWEEAS